MSREELELARLTAFLEGEQKERSRIGRELHDGIGAMLFTLSNRLKNFYEENKSNNAEALHGIIHLVNETTKALKDAAHCLIPETIVLKGIEESIVTYCELINPEKKPVLQLNFFGNWESTAPETLHVVFRMTQELIRNIIQHAKASYASITLSNIDNTIRLLSDDDGRGFDTKNIQYGSGLYSLYARVKLLNGTINIESSPGKGTISTIIIKL